MLCVCGEKKDWKDFEKLPKEILFKMKRSSINEYVARECSQ